MFRFPSQALLFTPMFFFIYALKRRDQVIYNIVFLDNAAHCHIYIYIYKVITYVTIFILIKAFPTCK